jgi:soluble lytic murein transglycosylase
MHHRPRYLLLVLLLLLSACGRPDEPPPAPLSATTASAPPTTVPPPAELLRHAMERRAISDDERAAQDLRALLDHHPGVPEARRARYYLAESFARREHWTSARAAFAEVVEAPEQDSLTAPALFWLARCYEELGQASEAIAAYQRYRDLHTPLAPYAAMRQAAQQQTLGQTGPAAQSYEFAAHANLDPAQRAASFEHAIVLYRQQGDDHTALRLYTALLDMAELPGYRARILAEAATLAEAMGQTEQARAWQREIITIAPATPHAVAATDALLAAGDTAFAPADAARVYYQAERYQDALPLLEQAIQQSNNAPTAEDVLELRRLRAMTLRALDDFPAALDALSAVVAASPDSDAGRQARLDWIQTLGQSGSVPEAASAYQEYATTYPDDPRAPVALDRAAQLLERLGEEEGAFFVRMDLEERYPDNELSPTPLHAAALRLFDQGRYDEAGFIWQHIANQRQGYLHALGSFWAARSARQQQQSDAARAAFEAAYQAAPDSYYGARAAEALGYTPAPVITLGAPMTDDDWRTLETWVAEWSGQPVANVAEAGYSEDLLADGAIQRAIGLNDVGLFSEATGEWNEARATWEQHPTHLLMLARIAHERQVPYIALKTAEQLAALAPPDAPPSPDALLRLIYPAPYADLVQQESRTYGIDPRLLYALMRQESLFNPHATSWVGARGLAQVMPATGEGIARQIDMADFATDDLYRPYVSIRFGAYYIAQQITTMEGSIVGGLAAYNGGPGNAWRWAGGSTVADMDVFTEHIDYHETRNYVRRVYGFYGVYQRLYALPEGE